MAIPDSRFFETSAPLSAAEACRVAGATLGGDVGAPSGQADASVTHASALGGAEAGAVCFLEDARTLRAADPLGTPTLLLTTEAAREAAAAALPDAVIGLTPRPKAAFAVLAARLHRSLLDAFPPLGGIAEDARIAASAQIAPSAVIGPGAEIGEDVVIGPHALIGPGVRVHAGTRIGPHVTLTHAVVGRDCAFSAGVRIGEAGFGYAGGEGGAVAVPQLGRVLIGDRVEVGANTTIDRGALGDTVIGEGTKIDNLCQVAHNVRLGAHVLMASQTGVSGSTVIGDGVMIGGQAGLADHLTVGDGAVISARSGLMKDVPAGERWGGFPAKPARAWLKETAALAKLAGGKK